MRRKSREVSQRCGCIALQDFGGECHVYAQLLGELDSLGGPIQLPALRGSEFSRQASSARTVLQFTDVRLEGGPAVQYLVVGPERCKPSDFVFKS
jgi:hypothetical protein